MPKSIGLENIFRNFLWKKKKAPKALISMIDIWMLTDFYICLFCYFNMWKINDVASGVGTIFKSFLWEKKIDYLEKNLYFP